MFESSSDDSKVLNPEDSIFQKPKCKFTRDKFIIAVQNGEITPFYPSSENKTFLNDIMCSICYRFFPRINKLSCCNFPICSSCFIFLDKCPLCKKKLSIKANCSSEQVSTQDDLELQKQYPDDTLDIAQEFGLDLDKVKKLLKSGFAIEDIFNENDFYS